jgi:formamidase
MRISVDRSVLLADDPAGGHNRWHPDIEPVARVQPGEVVVIETRPGDDGFMTRETTSADLVNFEFRMIHPLTGPIYVEGAEPGDVLEVEVLKYDLADFGWTALFPGFGFLSDLFPEPYLAKWEQDGAFARSAELPGIRVPAQPFAGIVGIAPSHELMATMHAREEELEARGGAVAPAAPEFAVPASAADGLRTVPPRETGGNIDVKQFTNGAKAFFTVQVPGALFSTGDFHFAQGDGETGGTAIETGGDVTVRFRVHKNPTWRPTYPAFESPPSHERRSFITSGIPVDREGRNESIDVTLAARAAVDQMIDYLGATRGLSPQQAAVLISVCVDLRVSEIVDVPNPLVAAVLPLDVFE